jgi:hypothetical protein
VSNPFANKQALIGKNVGARLNGAAGVLEVIEAEDIEAHPILKVVESEPLSKGSTQRDTHQDGIEVTIMGVRKGNLWLKEVKRQMQRAGATGKAFDKYSVVINFTDPNTNTVEALKVVNATITEIDAFKSGKNFEKQAEGFKMIGDIG